MSAQTKRRPADYYPTPGWCVDRLLAALQLPGGAWLEPSAGDGAIIRTVNRKRLDVEWTAVELRVECGERLASTGAHVVIADFLHYAPTAANHGRRWNVALLNPPFSLAMPFVEASLSVAEHVVVLQRLNWLEGKKRNPFFRRHAPDVKVLPDRPSFFDGAGTDSCAYAWFHWRRGEDRSVGTLEVLDSTAPDQLILRACLG